MHFLSITWLFWIWLTVSVYWIVPGQWRLPMLAGLTGLFLAIHAPVSAAILVVFTLTTYVAVARHRPTGRDAALAIGFMIAVLGYFKVSLQVDLGMLLDTVVIPLGLSYYTFRCIHVVLERVKGHAPPLPLRELVGYLFFLPTIVVGPIHRIDAYRRDLMRQRFDPALLSEGAERIIHGYAKIVILSNFLTEGLLGEQIAALPDQSGPLALYLTIVQQGLNLYFQFSGFSDIAIGFARLLGFRVMENFNWPYLQTNVGAFWRSWHLSLSQWCRDYIYGSVVSLTRSPAAGVVATMATIGLWHEISFRFLLWGVYHAAGILIWQRTVGWGDRIDRMVPAGAHGVLHVAKILLTVHFVWFGFVILTAASPRDALSIWNTVLFGWV